MSQEKPLEKDSEKSDGWKKRFSNFYDRHYKKFLFIPFFLLILSLGYLFYSYKTTGDFVDKDVTLTGGVSLTVFSNQEPINIKELSSHLSKYTSDFYIKELSDFQTGRQKAVVIESKMDAEQLKGIVSEFLGYNLTTDNSSLEITGATLGKSFYTQLRIALIVSFILMALVVFIIFRTFVPSFAVILSAFADIIMTLAFVDFIGLKISAAGITAFLMLIGYSVDTDIMLTARLLKRKDEINSLMWDAFKTGITMTLTSIGAVSIALFITGNFSAVLFQIFLILTVGLFFDILNTWLTNASLLKWYIESKKK